MPLQSQHASSNPPAPPGGGAAMRSPVLLVPPPGLPPTASEGAAPQPGPPLPPPNRTPALVLDHAGPHAPVAALAFSPDGSTLYVGGLDKLVRRYTLKGG